MLLLSHPIANIDHTKPLQDSCWSLRNVIFFCSFMVNSHFLSVSNSLFSLTVSKPISRLVSSCERFCQFVHWMAHQFVGPLTHLFVRLVHQFTGPSVCWFISFSVHDFVGISLCQSVSSSVSRPTGLRPSLNACARVNALTRDCIIYQPSFIHDTFFPRSLLDSILTLVFICRIDMDSK